MESLERLRAQLDSLDSLHTIVKTMKAMSAASIRQYEKAADSLADYYRTVELGLHVVLRDLQEPILPPPPKHEPLRLGAIVFGSDHGLCGRFNEEITTYALGQVNSIAPHPENRLLRRRLGARVHVGVDLGQHENVATSAGRQYRQGTSRREALEGSHTVAGLRHFCCADDGRLSVRAGIGGNTQGPSQL